MEKYFALILLAAPGFIAEKIATVLGITSPKRGEFDSLASYLSYSFFALIIAIAISAASGIISLSEDWQDFTAKFSSVAFTAEFLIIALISAFIVGSFWALIGNNLVMQILNFINARTGKNKRNLDGSLLNRTFADGKEHFLIVRKDGKDVAVGFIYAASDPFDDNSEVVITEYPEYRAELKKVKETDQPSYLRNVLQTYIDIKNNLVITETEYPPEWLSATSA